MNGKSWYSAAEMEELGLGGGIEAFWIVDRNGWQMWWRLVVLKSFGRKCESLGVQCAALCCIFVGWLVGWVAGLCIVVLLFFRVEGTRASKVKEHFLCEAMDVGMVDGFQVGLLSV